MKKKVSKLLAILLSVVMMINCDSSFIYAVETEQTEETVENGTDPEVTVTDESGEIADIEETGDTGESEETEETGENEETEETDSIAPDELFYRELTDEEQDAKDAASADEEEVTGAREGEDYLADEVIALCDTEEEAEEIAKAYAEATGYRVEVDSFSYGVAVLKMYGNPDKEKIEEYVGEYTANSFDSVKTFVKLSADTTNNLPPVYPNYWREAYSADTFNEEEFKDPMLKEGSEGYEGMYQWYHNNINDKFAWKLIDNGSINLGAVHVAVLDTGINYDHPDLKAIVDIHKNFAENPDDYESQGGDTGGHGTNVAGIIGNIANTIGGRGVAAGVKIDSYRVLGSNGAPDDWIISGLGAVLSDKQSGKNIKVINMSLGGVQYNGAYERVFKEIKDKGILVVAAAGNENTSGNRYPACYENVMSVAALDENYEKSSFSNYGNTVDISAPGGEQHINTNNPSLGLTQLWASGKRDADGRIRTVEGNNYTGMMGTSQATPVVSACAAILFAQHPGYSPDEVEAILEATARPVKSRYQIGAGCVDIAAAMNIDTAVPAPVASVASGKIASGDSVTISMPEGYEYSDYAMIYYTLNGKKPFDKGTKAEDVYSCKPGTTINPEGAGRVSLCMQATVFGIESEASTYNYTFEDSGVESISVKAPGNIRAEAVKGSLTTVTYPTDASLEVAVGKTVAITAAVSPSFAKNKKITWKSLNTDIATVDTTGKVKGINTGVTVVTASSADGYTVVKIPVSVKNATEQVVINKDIVSLTMGNDPSKEKYTFSSGEIKIYPQTASKRVYLKSSNEKIVTILEDYEGGQYIQRIKAVSPGEAVITATSADGSNVSDSVTVSVGSKIKKIEISDPTGENVLIAGGKYFEPRIIINDGQQVTVGSSDINWEIVSPSGKQTYLERSGNKIRIKSNYSGTLPQKMEIRAYSGTGSDKVVSNILNMTLYSRISSIYASEYASYYDDFQKGMLIKLSDLFSIYPASAYGKLKYTCKAGAKINNDSGYAILQKSGEIRIKAEATDGSGKSCEVSIYPWEEGNYVTGIRCKSGNAVLYPGKTIQMEPVLYKAGSLPCTLGCFIVNNGSTYKENSWVKTSGNSVTGQKSLQYITPGTKQVITLCEIYKYGSFVYNEPTDFNIEVELYPAATASINLKLDNGSEVVNNKQITIQPGDTKQIKPSSLPEGACQKYYTYKSSNTKVVTVDNSGKVKAVGNGKASVTVTAGDGSNKNAKVDFNVSRLATGITIGSKTGDFTLIPGKTLNLTATVTPADTVDKKIVWSITSGSNYATINATTGVLTGKAPGTVYVKALNTASGVSIKNPITIYPGTASITIDDADVAKNGLTLYTQSIGGCSNHQTFDFTVMSQNSGQALAPAVTSANANLVATPEFDSRSGWGNTTKYRYKVTAKGEKAGNTTINVAATDGSNKKVSVKVKVVVPVTNIQINSPGGASTLTPGKSLKLTAVTNKDATNKNVIWSFNAASDRTTASNLGIDVAAFEKNGTLALSKTANSSGTFVVKATAADGSGTSQTLRVATKPKLVTAVTIKESASGAVVKEVKLGTGLAIGNISNKKELYVDLASITSGVSANAGDFQNMVIATSSNEQIAKVDTDENDHHRLIVYTHKEDEHGNVTYQATKTGKVSIKVQATDGSNKSATLSVTVVEPVRTLYISADKTTRDLAANAKITLKAATQATATDKKVIWKLTDGSGNQLSNTIATISASGAVSPNPKLTSKQIIKAVATASDGSGTSNSETITLYPAQDKIIFKEGSNPVGTAGLTMTVGGSKTVKVESNNTGAYEDYYVTYTTGPVKVYYLPESESGTTITIKALKKGTSTVKATARDGSGKTATFRVTVK